MKTAVLSCVLFAAGALMLWAGGGSLTQARRASAWPTTVGAVVSSQCGDYSDMENGRHFVAEVVYAYRVADREYRGDRVAYGYSGGWWRAPNARIAERVASLDSIRVRYDPQHPATSVLAAGMSGANVLTLFAGAWLVLLAAVVVRFARQPVREPTSVRLEWRNGTPRVLTSGTGGAWLLAVVGWCLAGVIAAGIHLGIVSELVAR